MTENIEIKIVEIVEENGIEIDCEGEFGNIDSIKFISMLVSIEQEFNIEIPDDFLLLENIPNIDSITAVVKNELSKINA